MSNIHITKLQKRIIELKERKKALILAHNYQRPEIQEIADFTGDTLELCVRANNVDEAELIVVCGVDFIAETCRWLRRIKSGNQDHTGQGS